MGENRSRGPGHTFDGVNVGGGDDLVDLVPGAAHETAQAALGLWFAASGSFSTMAAQASTGLLATRHRARHCLSRRPRTIGYFTRLALYRVPGVAGTARQPRGSWLGRSGGCGVVGLLGFPGDDAALDVDLPRAEPVQFTPWVERTILSCAQRSR